ncbi:MAG: hypothetical protein WBR09_05925 [Serratia proteamaculans]
MTKTLTTERLREILERRSPSLRWGEAEKIAAELLANREAQPVSGECNREVYENGKSACLVDIPKETAEVICRGISAVTGCKVDWHYVGGRVHIKALVSPALSVLEGYKLAPVDPTPKQWAAGVKAMDTGMDKVTLVYKAMLATAPTQGENQ